MLWHYTFFNTEMFSAKPIQRYFTVSTETVRFITGTGEGVIKE